MATALIQATELSAVDTECIPRPEHPQPQLQRAEWANLNGIWDFQFDDENVGLAQNWQSAMANSSSGVISPGSIAATRRKS